jgi:protocatechuate 3,4-dioxygenase beta subunit
MPKNTNIERRGSYRTPVRRREALKRLGALAVTMPSLAAISCGRDPNGVLDDPDLGAGTGGVEPPPPPSAAAAGATGVGSRATAGGGGLSGASPAITGAGGAHSGGAGSGGAGAGGGGGGGPAAPAGSGGAAIGGASPVAAGSGGSDGAPDFIPVMFDDVASCTLTPTDPAGEGPFFVHEEEVMDDEDLIRSDMREGRPGVELQLNLRVLDSDGQCMKPISGVEVYTWHTDATGFYSGFADQNPDRAYMGAFERTVENAERFCRGIQVTGADGIVRFKTIYPGWYNGRAIHIHFVALRPGSTADTSSYRSSKYMVFTTQMYFAESFSRMIHENHDPYRARASGSAYNMYVKPQNMTVNPTARMDGTIAVAALNIVTSATGSRR